jgi:alkylation response protein AidB-like acyl-CoA dehydrogenase
MQARFSEDQELLRRSIAAFLAAECPVAALRRWMEVRPDGAAALPEAVWSKLAALGWPGLAIPPDYGGAGLGLVELAILMEETGRVLLPGPLFATAVLGARAVLRAGSEAQRRSLLPRIAEGRLRLGFADAGDPDEDELRLARQGGGHVLSGRRRFALEAAEADALLVAARDETGALALLLVPAASEGLTIRPVALVDPTRSLAELRFDAVRLDEGALLGEPGRGEASLGAVLDGARAVLAAEMAGGARQVLELSVRFARTREQFGRPIGSFQAIQHRLADMLVAVESASSAAYEAAWSVEHDAPDAHLAACLAKAVASDAYRRVAGDGIQVHGGLGFTWEQDPQLYYKRARSSELLLGDAAFHYELAAAALLDG